MSHTVWSIPYGLYYFIFFLLTHLWMKRWRSSSFVLSVFAIFQILKNTKIFSCWFEVTQSALYDFEKSFLTVTVRPNTNNDYKFLIFNWDRKSPPSESELSMRSSASISAWFQGALERWLKSISLGPLGGFVALNMDH